MKIQQRSFFASIVAFCAAPAALARRAASLGKTGPVAPPMFWYENANGDRWVPGEHFWRDGGGRPDGFDYQWIAEPTTLRESCCGVPGGLLGIETGRQIMCGNSGWSDDLVLAMANRGGYRLRDAIMIVAKSCERCMNALAFDNGLGWGYSRNSSEWARCGTSCDMCAPHHSQPDAIGIRRNLLSSEGMD